MIAIIHSIFLQTAFLVVFLVCFIASAQTFAASDITPSHVYQKAETLERMLKAQNLIDPERYHIGVHNYALRHPRHVIQKVRECHTVFSRLLGEKNQKQHLVTHLYSSQEVKPSDVYHAVEHLIEHLDKLEISAIEEPELQVGKTPSDVYDILSNICRATRAEITPSDVYQVATAIYQDLTRIADVRGYVLETPYHSYSGKKPSDVYQKTQAFMLDLRQLALFSDYAIPGGVIISDITPEDPIIPQDVIGLMYGALAETNAIQYALGVHAYNTLPPYVHGQTPSDVYSQIDHAHEIVLKLLELETE